MREARTNRELIKVPKGEKCIIWCGSEVEVLENAWGSVLIRYLTQGKGRRYTNSDFFIWTTGGGSGMNWGSVEDARRSWQEDIQSVQRFWERTIREDSIIVNGEHYHDGGPSTSQWKGFGGRLFIYKSLATGQVYRTNNMWHQGTVPDELKKSDTHTWVPQDSLTPEDLAKIPTIAAAITELPKVSVDQDRIVRH